MKIPVVVRTLLIVNVLVFIVDQFLAYQGFRLSSWGGIFYVGNPSFRAWQFVTYMFLHADFWHLFFNMFALWMFGRIMEQVWGGQRFLLFYFTCGIGAAVVQELGQALGVITPLAYTIGASGAIYGVLLAFGMTFPNERIFIIPIPFPIKAKYFVLFYAALELYMGFSGGDNVAHFAHLGGMLFGFFLILYWRRRARGKHLGKGSFWETSAAGGGHYDRGEGGIFDRLRKGFGQKGQQAQAERTGQAQNYGGNSDYAYNARKRAENEEIDRILDKIRQGGYASLTEEEKKRLFDASQKK